jgi:hypothetical protein
MIEGPLFSAAYCQIGLDAIPKVRAAVYLAGRQHAPNSEMTSQDSTSAGSLIHFENDL